MLGGSMFAQFQAHNNYAALSHMDKTKLLVAETSDADSFTVVSIRKAETGSSDEDDDEKHEEREEGEGTQEDNSTDSLTHQKIMLLYSHMHGIALWIVAR